MKLFRVIDHGVTEHYCGTLVTARKMADELAATTGHDVIVEQVEIATTVKNMLLLLNNEGGTHETVNAEAYRAVAKADEPATA